MKHMNLVQECREMLSVTASSSMIMGAGPACLLLFALALPSMAEPNNGRIPDEVARIEVTLERKERDVSNLFLEIADAAFQGGAGENGLKGILVREPDLIQRHRVRDWSKIRFVQSPFATALSDTTSWSIRPLAWRDGVVWIKVSNYEREDVTLFRQFELSTFLVIHSRNQKIHEFLDISEFTVEGVSEGLRRIGIHMAADGIRELGDFGIVMLDSAWLSDDSERLIRDIEFLLQEGFELRLPEE